MKEKNIRSSKKLKKYKPTRVNVVGEMNSDLIDYSWSISFDHKFEHSPQPFTRPRFKQAIGFLGTSWRCHKMLKECSSQNREAFIDFFSPLKCKQIFGAPMGGIGCGSIGRTFSGDFCRFQLIPGIYEHSIAEANMFTVCIRKNGTTKYQQALTTRSSDLKGNYGTYYALYPDSWYIYSIPNENITLTCHQISPIIPHNYKDTSLPVGLLNWTLENNNEEEVEIALMLTWQSGSASTKFELTDVKAVPFEHTNYGVTNAGVLLGQKLKDMPLEYAIAAKKSDHCSITYDCQFYPNNEKSGTQLWQDLYDYGHLTNKPFDELSEVPAKRLAIAVCVNIKLKPFSKETIDFSIVWNMPNTYFSGDKEKVYKRFYTRYFPNDTVNSSEDIGCYSVANQNNWLRQIDEWRAPILDNVKLPNFYKCCLFNELYFISDGGTIWFDVDREEKNGSSFPREYGRFAYLEGHEYRMYNTYDVHFYASFALVKLWPKLQQSLQYDFAETIDQERNVPTKFLFRGDSGVQKSKNCIPHDLGDPASQPWDQLNAYILHDTKDWKDLNLKFILSVYRDYYHTKDFEFIQNMWPYIKRLLLTIQSHDRDNDGLIDSEGFPDQTYDAWSVTGASAYVGGLHVATLKVVCAISKLLEDHETFDTYSPILKQASESYDAKLWNGSYYKYDCSNSDYNDSIMADMCCGHWFLRSSGFEYEAFEKEKIKSCLETIYEFNVMKYGNGQRGAVNGMKPNGRVDITSMQSEEVWVGITNALASLMVFEGMSDKAWITINGMYNLCYNKLGLAFQTPEALLRNNVYRSLGYMRPLCIWSIQYAIDMQSA